MAFDTRCLMTAEYFLGQPRTKADEESLAQAIQDAIEDWFAAREQMAEPCLSSAEQKAQGARCGCCGADDMCCCQNVPDATTRRERAEQKETAA